MKRRRTIAISALKGGVGKTTTAVNLAAAAARAGRSVLLVDVDPQGSVGSALGLEREEGLGEWLTGQADLDAVLQRERAPGLDVLPSGNHLRRAEERFAEKGRDKRRTRLARRLGALEADYEVVILDCPPSASLLLENAYMAADELVIPAKLDYLSLPAMEKTRALVKELAPERERPLRIDGILPTFYDLRTHVADDVLETLRERFTKILSPIRINAALAEAPSMGKTIYEFDGSARGAVDYALLAEDLKLA